MRPLFTVLAAVALTSLLQPPRALAGPWSPKPGAGYAKVWLKYLPGFGYKDGRGGSHDYGRYHELFLSAYGELGVAPRLALTGHLPLVRFFSLEDTRRDEARRAVTLGEPTLTARYQLLSRGRLAGAVEGLVTPNVSALRWRARGADAGASVNEPFPFYDKRGAPLGRLRIGNDAWDVGGALSLGLGLDRLYLAGSAGYLFRTNGYDDVLRWTAEVGGHLRGKWHGRLRLVGNHPLGNGDPRERHNSPSGIGSGTRYLGFALELEYEFRPGHRLGVTSEGGGSLRRQTGGPVTTLYWARGW